MPGWKAQSLMAPAARLSNEAYLIQNPEHKSGSVLLLLFNEKDTAKFIMIERTDVGVHSGQVGLPGGKFETSDETLVATALRETNEEIGVDINSVSMIGQLSELYIPVSKYRVQPFVGFVHSKPQLNPNPEEVKSVIIADAGDFLNDSIVSRKEFKTSYGLLEAPYYAYGNFEIWGATSMILSEFIFLLKNE